MRTRARGKRKMAWLKATVTGREMTAELPSLLFMLFHMRGSISRGTQ